MTAVKWGHDRVFSLTEDLRQVRNDLDQALQKIDELQEVINELYQKEQIEDARSQFVPTKW